MAAPSLPPVTGASRNPYHVYHADAYILEGKIEQPIHQPIQPYGRVVLEQTRRDTLITQSVGETEIEGLISFKRGRTRVIGTHVRQKTDIFGRNHAGWATLATAEIEGYNVLDIITADRVVAQITTDHTLTGDANHPVDNVPRVSFLGSTFENLQIAGVLAEVELNLAFCSPKPENDRPYLRDEKFLDAVHRQLDKAAATPDLPKSLGETYGKEIAYIDELKRRAKDGGNNAGAEAGSNGYPKLRCSLVQSITLKKKVPGVHTFGNQVFIEDFGSVSLAELEIGIHKPTHAFAHRQGDQPADPPTDSNYFTLNMMAIRLGCSTTGVANGSSASSNGQNSGPGHTT